MMLKLCVLSVFIFHHSFCLNGNNSGRSYYFRIGKNYNEFKVNNRIYFVNHNSTDHDITLKPVNNMKLPNEKNIINNYNLNFFLDDEWNFDRKNLCKTEIPKFIHKYFEKYSRGLISSTEARILFNVNRNVSSNIIKFNLSSLKPNSVILDAELYFFWSLKNTSKIYKESVVLRLYQFGDHSNGTLNELLLAENPDVHKLFNVIYISKAQKGWQTFRIKKPIDNWLNGEQNLGLLLTISGYDDNDLISIFNDTNVGIYSTFAVVTVQNNGSAAENNVYSPSNFSQCHKRDWHINFKKLHWEDFIIAPLEFNAYNCEGYCATWQSSYENHEKLLYIFNKRSSCCVPVAFSSLPIMFYDKYGNIAIKNYENLIVNQCECR